MLPGWLCCPACLLLCVWQANGIRCLMQLLQPRHGSGANALPAAALDRMRYLACLALVGLAADTHIRQILTRLQVIFARHHQHHPLSACTHVRALLPVPRHAACMHARWLNACMRRIAATWGQQLLDYVTGRDQQDPVLMCALQCTALHWKL